MALLDLVALATVADVAPLIGVNRALVDTGLEVMARRERPGLVALADVAGIDRGAGPPTISASCSDRGSTPAGGSATPGSRRAAPLDEGSGRGAALAERLEG